MKHEGRFLCPPKRLVCVLADAVENAEEELHLLNEPPRPAAVSPLIALHITERLATGLRRVLWQFQCAAYRARGREEKKKNISIWLFL